MHLFIISGPSGVGEDSVISGLERFFPLERVITTTTRSMRPGESEGNPYHFISRKAFEKGIQAGDFIEYAKEYNDNYYGVTRQELERVQTSGKVGIWKIEYKGVIKAKELYPDITAILLSVSDIQVLENRIRRRDPDASDEYIQERMTYTKEWLNHASIYDYTVYNEENKLDETIEQVRIIISKHL